MEIAGTQTEQNFKNAITGDHHALEKFLRWRSIADVVGPPEVQALYRATKMLVAGHAMVGEVYKQTLSGVKPAQWQQPDPDVQFTEQDVEKYLGYSEVAKEEGFDEIAEWFEALAAAERSQIPKTN
jgi:rubrerythrin